MPLAVVSYCRLSRMVSGVFAFALFFIYSLGYKVGELHIDSH